MVNAALAAIQKRLETGRAGDLLFRDVRRKALSICQGRAIVSIKQKAKNKSSGFPCERPHIASA
jgi:hypothetical protein